MEGARKILQRPRCACVWQIDSSTGSHSSSQPLLVSSDPSILHYYTLSPHVGLHDNICFGVYIYHEDSVGSIPVTLEKFCLVKNLNSITQFLRIREINDSNEIVEENMIKTDKKNTIACLSVVSSFQSKI